MCNRLHWHWTCHEKTSHTPSHAAKHALLLLECCAINSCCDIMYEALWRKREMFVWILMSFPSADPNSGLLYPCTDVVAPM